MGEDKTWTQGPWTTSLDWATGSLFGPVGSMDPLFFISKKIEKKEEGTPHILHPCCFSTESANLFRTQ